MKTTEYAHIEMRDGVPYLIGTQTKVVEIALDRLIHDRDAYEIHRQHPHLSLGQIYSALAYYYDHEKEMDRDIEERAKRADAILASLGESSIRLKLKAQGHLP